MLNKALFSALTDSIGK